MTEKRTGRRKKQARPRTKLAKIMREQGRTYVWLAEQTGYGRTQLNAMANKRVKMSPRLVKLAAHALGVPEETISQP